MTPGAALGVMDMFDKMKNWLGKNKKQPLPKVVKSQTTAPPKKSAKELATEQGLPYVAVVSMDIDSKNLHQGAFELDWNDKFIADLVRAGYSIRKDDTDADIVDRWFQNVCRHVVMETWEQDQANKNGYIKERNLGDGRSEVS